MWLPILLLLLTPSKQFGVVVNLATTDQYSTPAIRRLDFLMECDISYLRSIVAESLIASMREAIRPVINVAMPSPGGAIHSLKDLETPYNITQIVGVYNHTDDPNHQTNLFDTYDAASRNIRTTVDIERGKAIWVDFEIRAGGLPQFW